MKPSIAWITYDLPYPPTSGGKLRALNLIKQLSRGFNIHLFTFYRREDQLANLNNVTPYVSGITTYQRRWIWDVRNLVTSVYRPLPLLSVSYSDNRLRDDLENSVRTRRFGLYHFEFMGAASYLPNVAKLGGRTVMGNENIEFKIYESYSQRSKIYPLIPFFKYDVWKMRRFEHKLWKLANANLAVCSYDAAVVESDVSKVCTVVPNAVEIKESYPLSISQTHAAYFSGDLNYRQNRDAVLWFLEAVAPTIKAKIPDFKLIVLSNSKPGFTKKYSGILDVTGDESTTFDSLLPLVEVFVSPIRIKSGTNIKILQAAACGLPIVSTASSISGYDFEDGKDVMIADDPIKYSESVIRILLDRDLGVRLSSNSFSKVKKYSWENSAKILEDVYHKVLS
jgi:glycosyltransferase involved in cell wall biosynthesis